MHERPHNLYSSPHITRIIKSRMRCAGHAAHIGGGGEKCIHSLWENMEERE
jgi:hypothetical protein